MIIRRAITKLIVQRVLVAAIIVSAFSSGFAIPEDLGGKISVFFTHEAKNYILKFRPVDYTFPSRTLRFDLLLGKRFVNKSAYFTAYGYWKQDNKGNRWMGTQFDLGQKMLKNKISAALVFRFFAGLNSISMPHFYFIPTLYFHTGSKGITKAGISGYGKKVKGQSAFFYLGFDAMIEVNKQTDLLLSVSKNTLGPGELIRMSVYFGL